MSHTCQAHGCTRQIGSHLLMCPTHWSRVPGRLQRELNLAWRNLRVHGGAEHLAHYKSLRALIVSNSGPAPTSATSNLELRPS